MRLEELKAQLEETQNLIQEKSQEETDMRQRARFCRDQIKLYNNEIAELSYEQQQLTANLGYNTRELSFLQAKNIDLVEQIAETELNEKIKQRAGEMPSFWTSFESVLKREIDNLDGLIANPSSSTSAIERIKRATSSMRFGGGISQLIRVTEMDYNTAITELARAKVTGVALTPSLINKPKQVISKALNNEMLMPYWVTDDDKERERA